jgi:hypothetical protein
MNNSVKNEEMGVKPCTDKPDSSATQKNEGLKTLVLSGAEGTRTLDLLRDRQAL